MNHSIVNAPYFFRCPLTGYKVFKGFACAKLEDGRLISIEGLNLIEHGKIHEEKH